MGFNGKNGGKRGAAPDGGASDLTGVLTGEAYEAVRAARESQRKQEQSSHEAMDKAKEDLLALQRLFGDL